MLAGQRPEGDPLAQHCGEAQKALIPIHGRSMLARVCSALLESPAISRIVILAQETDQLAQGLEPPLAQDAKISFASSGSGIAASIAEVAGGKAAPWPVLVTTADHALLTSAMVHDFLSQTEDADLSIAVGERRIVEAAFPATRRTWLKFSDGHYSGANMFALRGAEVVPALKLWSGVEQDRKRGLAIMARFGPYLLLRALTRTIGFAAALKRAGARLGLTAKPVIMPQADAVIDVDKIADLELVTAILAERE